MLGTLNDLLVGVAAMLRLCFAFSVPAVSFAFGVRPPMALRDRCCQVDKGLASRWATRLYQRLPADLEEAELIVGPLEGVRARSMDCASFLSMPARLERRLAWWRTCSQA